MSDQEFRDRLVQAIEWLIGVAKHHSVEGLFAATITQADGSVWQVLVRPGRIVPVASIIPPQPVIFSLN